MQPTLTPMDRVIKAIGDLIKAIKGTRNVEGIKQIEANKQLENLLNKIPTSTTNIPETSIPAPRVETIRTNQPAATPGVETIRAVLPAEVPIPHAPEATLVPTELVPRGQIEIESDMRIKEKEQRRALLHRYLQAKTTTRAQILQCHQTQSQWQEHTEQAQVIHGNDSKTNTYLNYHQLLWNPNTRKYGRIPQPINLDALRKEPEGASKEHTPPTSSTKISSC